MKPREQQLEIPGADRLAVVCSFTFQTVFPCSTMRRSFTAFETTTAMSRSPTIPNTRTAPSTSRQHNVADRENDCIEKFNFDGTYIGQIAHLGRVYAIKFVTGTLWASVGPPDQPPGSPGGWIVELDAKTGQVLGHLDVAEGAGCVSKGEALGQPSSHNRLPPVTAMLGLPIHVVRIRCRATNRFLALPVNRWGEPVLR